MFKSLTDLIHRTPWLGLLGSGFAALLFLVVFSVPFQIIAWHERGANPAEQRAIQREIDAAMARNGLGVAERVVRFIQQVADDPVRQAELQRGLDEIARARREIEGKRAAAEGPATPASPAAGAPATPAAPSAEQKEIAEQARAAQREAELAAREAELESMMAVYEAAVDARVALEEATEDARRALREANVAEADWPKSLAERMDAARAAEAEGKRRVDQARERFNAAHDAADAASEAAIVIDLPHSPRIELPETTRADIASAVASDFQRMLVGVLLILLLLPLFTLLIVAKIFIDRARGAQQLAEEKSHEAEEQSMRRQLMEARLLALQAQVEPHFLYNTLANVQALIEVDPAAANTMVSHLIDYLRAALPKMRESQSNVRQETDLARAYLNILKMRMGSRLEFAIEVAPEAEALPMPPMMLPSLVENAIKHGLEPQRAGGRVEIDARLVDGELLVTVRDSGRGLPTQGPLDSAGTGVGLANIRERLAAMYGEGAGLTLRDRAGALDATGELVDSGVEAVLRLPPTPASVLPRAAVAAKAAAPVAAPPQTPAQRFATFLGEAHTVWRRFLGWVWVLLMAVLLVTLFGTVVAALFGELPVQIGELTMKGPGGAVLGILAMLAAFGLLAVAGSVVVGVIYLLGFVVIALVVIVPLVMVLSMAPALAPFALLALLVYWLIKKRQSPVRP